MTVGVVAAAQVQRHPPGQQMRLRRLAGAEPSSRAAARSASRSSCDRHRADRVPRPDKHEPGVRLPPGTLLGPEQAVGSLRPVQGGLRLRGGQRAVGRHQQQFGLLGGPATDLLDVTYRGLRLGQRVAGQPGRQQDLAPVEAERLASARSAAGSGRPPHRGRKAPSGGRPIGRRRPRD